MLLDIRPDHLRMVCDILAKHVPQYEVWAFGSRAKWTAKDYSDLDLCIKTDQPLDFKTLAGLEEDFAESDLPWKVDVVDWATTSESFRKIIERDKVLVQKARRGWEMKSDSRAGWKSMPLEDWMAAIIDYRGKTPEKTRSGIPLITAKIVKGGRIADPEEFIAEDAYDQWMRRGIPEPGDVVLTTEAPLGEVAQLDGRKVALAQRIITLRGKPDLLDNTYLKFALQSSSIQEQLHSRASGSTVTGIKQSELRKLQLSFPSIQEQKRIANILGSLEDKIQLNRQINQTLEQIAQAIFKSWFIDFDPVKAKIAAKENGEDPERAAMRTISGKTDAELDQLSPEQFQQLSVTAALFPDEFEDSELGEIPKGWQVLRMKDLAEKITKGTTPTKNDLLKAEDSLIVPFIKVKDITDDGEIVRDGIEKIADSIHRNALKRSILRTNDLLFSIAGTIGRVSIVDSDLDNSNTNQAVAFIRLKDQKHIEFCFQTLKSKRTQKEIASKVVQGVQANISLANIGDIKVIDSGQEVLKTWGLIIRPIMSEKRNLSAQLRSLGQVRDSLLPKLLSGEISVAQAEQTLEDAACA